MKEDYRTKDLASVFENFEKRLAAIEQKVAEEPKKNEDKEKEPRKYAKPYAKLYGKPFLQAVLSLIEKLDLPEDASVEELIEKLKKLPEEELKKFTFELFGETAAIRDEATGEIVGFRKNVVDNLFSEMLLKGEISRAMYNDIYEILNPKKTGESTQGALAFLPMPTYTTPEKQRIDEAVKLLMEKPKKREIELVFEEA